MLQPIVAAHKKHFGLKILLSNGVIALEFLSRLLYRPFTRSYCIIGLRRHVLYFENLLIHRKLLG